MAEIEDIREQFADLQKTVTAQTARLGEQAALLDQARQDQKSILAISQMSL